MQYALAINKMEPGAGSKPMDDLRDAANAGWGTGVQDLNDAFGHVAKTNGVWSDVKYHHYTGSSGPYYSFIPNAAYNFFKAIEERIAAAAILQDKRSRVQVAIEAVLGPHGSPVWPTLAGHVKSFAEGLGEMEKYMWLIPAGVAGGSSNLAHSITDGLDIVEKVNEYAGMFLTAQSETRSAIASFDSALVGGFTGKEAVLLAGLQRVAGFLPVLGEFYSQAIGLIPTVATLMTTIAEHKQEMLRLAQYGPTYGQQMRHLGSQ